MKMITLFKTFLIICGILVITGLILAYYPVKSKTNHKDLNVKEATQLREAYHAPHELFKTSDGETLFLRKWNPDSLNSSKKDIAVLLFHGFTAYSGAYEMAGIPIAKSGYTVFGLDYRGHGLSGGNRGDSPGKDRWIADLAESVQYVKKLGYKKIIVLGHSLGVASAICAGDAVPELIDGYVLLSGAYEGKKSVSKPISFFEKTRMLSAAVFRPSYPAVEYYREGMHVTNDPLFNFHYTVRFLTMLNVAKLKLPKNLNKPVLVAVGDQDELFDTDKVRAFYDSIPGNKKDFLIMKNTTHAKIPPESWQEVIQWLDKTFIKNEHEK